MLRERVGSNLPFPSLREFWFDIFPHQAEKLISSDHVVNYYLEVERRWGTPPRDDVISMIKFHHHYQQTTLTLPMINRINWYFDPHNPNHISQALTLRGADRALLHVAKRFRQKDYDNSIDPWKEQDVISILDRYNRGEFLPAVILTPRPLGARPDDNLYVIDGIHRLLAIGTRAIKTGSIPEQQAFIAN